jgi:hypothetical protein
MSNIPSNSQAGSSDEAQKTAQPGGNPSPAQQNQGDKPANKPSEQQK